MMQMFGLTRWVRQWHGVQRDIRSGNGPATMRRFEIAGLHRRRGVIHLSRVLDHCQLPSIEPSLYLFLASLSLLFYNVFLPIVFE